MKVETPATLARYVETTVGFVPSLTAQALEAKPDRASVLAAVVAMRDAQKRIGLAMNALLDYEESLI